MIKLFGLLGNLAVILSVVITWVIYYAQREDAKILQHKQLAVEMLTLGNNDNIVNAKSNVTRFILSHSSQIQDSSATMATGKHIAIPLDNASRTAFLMMTEHYDRVIKCRESRECDASMIDLWYREDICDFTEFGQIFIFQALAEDFGVTIGDRLTAYQKSNCPTTNG